jgi:hypothetical protein
VAALHKVNKARRQRETEFDFKERRLKKNHKLFPKMYIFATMFGNAKKSLYIDFSLYKTESSMAGIRKGRCKIFPICEIHFSDNHALTRSFSDSFHSSEKFVRSCMVVRKMNFTHWPPIEEIDIVLNNENPM